MYDNDTRAVFVGGPVDGRLEMLQGKPGQAQFDHFRGRVGSEVLVKHTYRRDDTRFMEGDMIAYVYEGEEVID